MTRDRWHTSFRCDHSSFREDVLSWTLLRVNLHLQPFTECWHPCTMNFRVENPLPQLVSILLDFTCPVTQLETQNQFILSEVNGLHFCNIRRVNLLPLQLDSVFVT